MEGGEKGVGMGWEGAAAAAVEGRAAKAASAGWEGAAVVMGRAVAEAVGAADCKQVTAQ